MNITEKSIVGELVAQDYRTAEVFSKFGIDFCCKGNQSIKDVCEKKEISSGTLIASLIEAGAGKDNGINNYKFWPLDLLTDYIEKKHHRYVTERTPVIQKYLAKVSLVHSKAHPELNEIKEEFDACAMALAAHMKKEELILFPFIRKMVVSDNTEIPTPKFGTVQNPIDMMKEEHDVEGERFRKISQLSNNYTPPDDACNTFRVTYSLLKEFEDDLHHHIHLENNILFPKAIQLETELSQNSCEIH